MKQKITKMRAYLTIDDEEVFLNEMCRDGWKPTSIIFGMIFKFERCKPGEYIAGVTTAFGADGKTSIKSKREQITEYLLDSGAEIIRENFIPDKDTRIYAIRPASLGEFEINTNVESLIADYSARRRQMIIYTALLLVFAIILGVLGVSLVLDGREAIKAAAIEFVCMAIELSGAILCATPVIKYNRLIRRLKSGSEIYE